MLKDFEIFCKVCFKMLQGGKLKVEPHHAVLCDTINKVIDGDITRLVVNIPPRHTKTLFFTVMLIARSFAGNGSSESIQTSFSDNNVTTNSNQIQTILSHPDFIELFGTRLDKSSEKLFETTLGGKCHNRTMRGQITGVGCGSAIHSGFCGGLFIDDPLKPDEGASKTSLTRIQELYVETLSNRAANPSVPQIIIMQRLAEDDLAGFVLKGGAFGVKWHYLNIPAVVDKSTGSPEYYARLLKKYPYGIPVLYSLDLDTLIHRNLEQEFKFNREIQNTFKTVEAYKESELDARLSMGRASLWAEKNTLATYDSMQEVQGKYFKTQMLGDPVNEGGSVFKTEWFKHYDGFHAIDRSRIKCIRIYVDTAMKAAKANDRSAFSAWAKLDDGTIYMIDGIAGRWEVPDMEQKLIDFYHKIANLRTRKDGWRLECVKIEDKGSGIGLLQRLNRINGVNAIAVPRNGKGSDKYTRACEVTPEIHAGRVYVNPSSIIGADLIQEASEFTDNDSHQHDDKLQCRL